MRVRVIGYLIVAATVQGCTPAVQVGPKDFNAPPRAVNTCVAAKAPPPLAERVTIRIAPGKNVYADAGGETLLRQYAALREAIQAGWLRRCSGA